MRDHLDQILEISTPIFGEPFEGFLAFIYLAYWHAGLYVVIEGWQELELVDEKIDTLLSSENVDLLRRYRNGVFHFQKDYFDTRFFELYEAREKAVNWIRQLNDEFHRFFLEWARKEANIPSEKPWEEVALERMKRRGRPLGRPDSD